jgi:hypothetical protein
MAVVCNYGENIVGPFKQTVFLGCSVKSFGCTIGWNEQVTNLTVELVEDPCPGDKVYYNSPGSTPEVGVWTQADPGFEAFQPSLGAPVYFRVGTFEFAGVVQGWTKKDDTGGLDQYTVNISDPRFLLQNTQVIINEFDGSVETIYNVINPFGFIEDYGFGLSDVNEVGVPWIYIKYASSSLLSNQAYLTGGTSTPAGVPIPPSIYGPRGGVVYRSHDWDTIGTPKFGLIKGTGSYKDLRITSDFGGEHANITTYYVDIDDIPFVLEYYRLQAPQMSLLEIISQVCEDAGCDFYIELFITKMGEKVIKVKTQQRRIQPTLGKIQEFIDSRTGVISKNVGRELRNEATQSFAYGASKQFFVETDNSQHEPYWGKDTEGYLHIWDTFADPAGILGTMYRVSLDIRELNTTIASPVPTTSVTRSDGSTEDGYIVVTEAEMRCAIAGFASWQNFIQSYNSGGGTITGQWAIGRGFKRTIEIDALDGNADPAGAADNAVGGMMPNLGNFEFNASNVQDAKKIHAFISQFADEYYGKKALVPLGADWYFNIESQTNFFEALPVSEAWVEAGGTWLGITKPSVYLDQFTTEEGMISCGIRHSATSAYVRDAGAAVTDTNYIYISATAESDPILKVPQGSTAGIFEVFAIVNFSTIAEYKVQEQGTESFMAGTAFSIRSFSDTDIIPVLGGFGMGLGADVSLPMSLKRVYPSKIAVPIRTNYIKYGAFGYVGPPGPVNMKPDDSLSPWSYGGTTTMNLVADAQSRDGLTFMQVGERGSVTWPGYPEHRIGSELRSSEVLYKAITISSKSWGITGQNGRGATDTGTQYYSTLSVAQAKGDFGPNITSIAVNIASGGITTTYELSTFTPSFGRLSKLNTERLKRAAKNRVRLAKMDRKLAFMKSYTQLSRNGR